MISVLSIHLTPIKSWNRVYKCWVRPELQHDVIRCPGHCIIATAWHDITSWALNRLIMLLTFFPKVWLEWKLVKLVYDFLFCVDQIYWKLVVIFWCILYIFNELCILSGPGLFVFHILNCLFHFWHCKWFINMFSRLIWFSLFCILKYLSFYLYNLGLS